MTTEAIADCWLTPDLRLRQWRTTRVSWPAGEHAAVEICVPTAGELTYRIAGRLFVVQPGQAMVLPARIEHKTIVQDKLRARSVWLTESFMAQAGDVMGIRLTDAIVRPAASLAAFVEPLTEEAGTSQAGRSLLADGLAHALAVTLLRDQPQAASSTKDPRIARALDKLHADFAEPLTIAELAQTAGLSRFHFGRCFADVTGLSPHRYLTQVRVQAGASLLRLTRRSVTEVALSVGFGDASAFARAFRRQFGQSPSAYAAQNTERSAQIA